MLKDLSRADWLSFLEIPEDRVPDVLMLRGTRNLRTNYARHLTFFTDPLEIGSPNGIFEDVFIGRRNGVTVGYASVYGDAMASEITHLFGMLGTSLVIHTGCCGALGDGILPGDLVIATDAGCGEGAAQYYQPSKDQVAASPALVARVTDDIGVPIPHHAGPIWTTSALLAEGMAELRQWYEAGFIAVDMETATTFAVAEYFGMARLSLLFVFDNPFAGDHLLLTEFDKQAARERGERAMLEVAFTLIDGHR